MDQEIEKYLLQNVVINDSIKFQELGPFYFYNQFHKIYPKLAKLASRLLIIPATSVPSESAFSAARLIETDLRNRMKPMTLEMLLFLKDKINLIFI